jgi:hypothetical protein
MSWGPKGSHFFVTYDGSFSFFETRTWIPETFDFAGINRAAAWTPDGLRVAIVMDHVAMGDRVWLLTDSFWAPATVLAMHVAKAHVDVDGEGTPRWVPLDQVYADCPVSIGTVRSREDATEFSIDFETAFLPPLEDLPVGASQLPSSKVCDLSWSPDGTVLLVSYFVRAPGDAEGHGAVAAFAVRHGPLSFSPLKLLDLRLSEHPPRGCAFWPKKGKGVAAATWGLSRDLLNNGQFYDSGVAVYRI